MYDLHCHMLPAIDDGARNLETALQMARIAVDDGITHLACTPHIYPGMFENDAQGIGQAIEEFSGQLKESGIALQLGIGADVHMVPEVPDGLRTGRIPTINGSRYFLLEPPHHVAPPRFEETVFDLVAYGYVPVITHPERLSWVGDYYEVFHAVVKQGAWIQITSGSVTGRFGEEAQFWAQKMLEDGIVHILATDAHNLKNRAPLLAEGRDAAACWVGEEEASRMVLDRPKGIWEDVPVEDQPPALVFDPAWTGGKSKKAGFFSRLFGR
jgi:protein-tyrosine phosphatase